MSDHDDEPTMVAEDLSLDEIAALDEAAATAGIELDEGDAPVSDEVRAAIDEDAATELDDDPTMVAEDFSLDDLDATVIDPRNHHVKAVRPEVYCRKRLHPDRNVP